MAKRVAVIDIGSNSVRMVIYEKTSRFAFHILHEAKSRVRLSQNAYVNNGYLQEASMQRAFEALKDFLSVIASFKARKTLCVATSALRDAPNKKEFVHRVKKSLGLNIKIIDGQKEAYLGAVACTNLLPRQESALCIDIGGGSTEFSLLQKKNIHRTFSLDLGTVRLKELFFDKGDIAGATRYIDKQLDALEGLYATSLIGIGGSFRAISDTLMQITHYPLKKLHAYEPNYKEFKEFLEKILLSNESELKNFGFKNARLDVIKPGSLILLRVLHKIGEVHLMSSGAGIREGLFLTDLLRTSKDKFPVNYNTSVRYILDAHVDNTAFANQVCDVAKKLFDLTHEYLQIERSYRNELTIAAKLCLCGSSIDYYSHNKRGYEIIKNALGFGFTHKQIILIATLVKYAKRKLPSTTHFEKYKKLLPPQEELHALSFLLSLSLALLSHHPRNMDFSLDFTHGKLIVLSENSLYLAKESIEKLESIQNLKISVPS